MAKPTLYLMIGYPGAGKTTVSKAISLATGANHIWADVERHKLFPNPSHSKQESDELYDRLNAAAEYLLAQGKSVVYDTNFNFYADRLKMRAIAKRQGADCVVIWVTTPLEIARDKAVCAEEQRNGYVMSMTEQQFNSIVSKLEPPHKDEKVIKIDNPHLDKAALLAILKQ